MTTELSRKIACRICEMNSRRAMEQEEKLCN